ncbi:MAG: hypothetical protein M1817_000727 [Caeruleum heppii]|nr:MAG: hypothetical protein M1817_000727 [Caeruleum heppii]
MPFPFNLPTTSSLSFRPYLSSPNHPSLPLTATTHRGLLRDILKSHKRLSGSAAGTHLPQVLSALTDYLPYLFALDAGLSGKTVAAEEVDVVLEKEIEVEWRPTIGSTALPLRGRDPPRIKMRSLESELCFVLSTLGYVYTLLARSRLYLLHGPVTPSPDQRTNAIVAARKHLLQAASIHQYQLDRVGQWTTPAPAVDISSGAVSALSSLALAEATLLAVLKDDPYPAVVSQDRNKNDNEWMIKAPDIPKVRAHLFARLCLASAEHARKALAALGCSGRINDLLLDYIGDLQKTSRGKACRFLAIDADLGGKTGEAIAWLRGGRRELGFAKKDGDEEAKRRGGLGGWRKQWTEKREDKKIERGGDSWGLDAGRLEEGRVIDMLEAKWVKMNDTVGADPVSKYSGFLPLTSEQINTQTIPASDPLLASMPSGREIHSVPPYHVPELDADVLARMRAPPDTDGLGFRGDEDDSDDEERDGSSHRAQDLPGAFPGSKTVSGSGSAYY